MRKWSKVLPGAALVILSAGASADALQVRGMAASCTSCHGTNGVAQQGMVSLAGQPKDELLKKLLEFKAGTRSATIMHQLSKGYSDQQLEDMAGYFAALKR